jgi:beta-glucosidase/6-phospho-beta-glucosidase/beta-galactosidase
VEDGGASVWDVLFEFRARDWPSNYTGEIICDHYHRIAEDVALIETMGLKAYRFSISRVRMCRQAGAVNEQGIEFTTD